MNLEVFSEEASQRHRLVSENSLAHFLIFGFSILFILRTRRLLLHTSASTHCARTSSASNVSSEQLFILESNSQTSLSTKQMTQRSQRKTAEFYRYTGSCFCMKTENHICTGVKHAALKAEPCSDSLFHLLQSCWWLITTQRSASCCIICALLQSVRCRCHKSLRLFVSDKHRKSAAGN